MPKRREKRTPVPPSDGRALVPVGISGVGISEPAGLPTLQELDKILTPKEEAFARLFTIYSNATRAYVEAMQHTGSRGAARVSAWEMARRPHVLRRIRDYESAAAAATVIDYAAILEHDRAIVEGYKHADQVTQHIWQACRHCYGVDHKYHWIDFAEYLAALAVAEDVNEIRREKKQSVRVLPTDEGGYGFTPSNDPVVSCPRCEGRGNAITVIADTTQLSGPARAIVKGVKVTANGIEVMLHDIDKAKERLLRAGGIFGDDAQSVARGAAAGAAAGATAAIAAAKATESMTAEQAQRLYLELA